MASASGRPVVASMFLTLDGYIVGEDEDMSWAIEGFDAEMQGDVAEEVAERSDTFLFGRVTYEILSAYWPGAQPYGPGDEVSPASGKEDPRIIRALNESPKVVFSRTLEHAEWSNTRVVREGLEDEIRALKGQPGKAIGIQGSASIVRALGDAGLVDEYKLYVHPVLLGAGKPMFASGARRHLALAGLKRYANGVVMTHYVRRAA
jgi:dihydrofolate reductase